MRMLALVVAFLSGCSPVLVTYVAPPTATNLRSSDDADQVAKAYGVNTAGLPVVVLPPGLPFTKRTITFTCGDGTDRATELVNDTADASAVLGLVTFGGAGLVATGAALQLQTNVDVALAGLAVAAPLALLGGLATLTGWHPAPHKLVDGAACGDASASRPAAPTGRD